MQRNFTGLVVPALGTILFCSSALAQGGGFVFDEPDTPPVIETPEPEPEPEADPAADDLDSFTFGGAPAPAEVLPASAEELALWEDAESAETAEAFRRYLEDYPEGIFAEDARARLAALQAAADRRQGLVTACDRMAGDPADPQLAGAAAGVAMEEIDTDAALWTCSRALAAAPDLARLSYNMGRISEAQGQGDAALRSYRTAMQQAIEQEGTPYLPAAAGILRLSEPRNATERMSHVLLQASIDSEARITALQARLAELDEALAVATANAAETEALVATRNTEIEVLTAREIDMSNALSTAEADSARLAELQAELAALRVRLAEAEAGAMEATALSIANATLKEELSAQVALNAALTAALADARDGDQ